MSGRSIPAVWGGVGAWVFMGKTEVEAETPILWPTDVKS